MNTRWNKALLALGVSLSVASVLAAVAYSGTIEDLDQEKTQQSKRKTYEPAKVTEAPLVVSKVKGLEITQVTLQDQGTSHASIRIDVTNTRDAAVMALNFISGGRREATGLGFDGLLFEFEDTVSVVIPPHSLKSFTWLLANIMKGETVFLAAAIFDDGKEEGDKFTLDGIKLQRKNFQQRQREEKAKKGGQP